MEKQTKKITNEEMDVIISNSKCYTNSLGIMLTYKYLSDLVELDWYDILFSIENCFLPHQSAVDHAIVDLELYEFNLPTVLELACLTQIEAAYIHNVLPYVKELAKPITDVTTRRSKEKLLYAVLNWLYENKDTYEDPFRAIELIYDDFDFPKSMRSFVGYLPSEQPPLPTREASINKMYDNWKEFLNSQRQYYKK